MELDLLAAAETESDSESNHSNQDNASGRRSVVTAATAGSEAGNALFISLCLDLFYSGNVEQIFKTDVQMMQIQLLRMLKA